MKTKTIKPDYQVRYTKIIQNLSDISEMMPKELYLYPLMDRVIFCDFETALDGVMEDYFNAQNDNNK